MKLYKYIGMSDHVEQKVASIGNGFFRFSPARQLNDKYEGRWAGDYHSLPRERYLKAIEELRQEQPNRFLTWKDIEDLETPFPFDELGPRIFPAIYFGISEEDLGIYQDFYKRDLQDQIIEITDNVGILSLTQEPDSQLMWSHYANGENGVCVEIDASNPFFDGRLRKVRYSGRRISMQEMTKKWKRFKDFDREDEIAEWIRESFCVKSTSWKYEREYRLFKDISGYRRHGLDDLLLERLPMEVILAVHFGSELDNAVEYELQRELSKNKSARHVKRIKIKKSNTTFSYEHYHL